MLFKLEEFEKLTLPFSVDGEHFENDDVRTLMIFPSLSFPGTQIQNGR